MTEVTLEILVNYCAEPAADGPGVPAAPRGTWSLGSRRKSPPRPAPLPQGTGMSVRRTGETDVEGGEGEEVQCHGLPLHSAFCNNENYPPWTRD